MDEPVGMKTITNIMNMIVIENNIINHLERVKTLFGKCDEALIVSPFVSSFAINSLNQWVTAKFKKLTFITTLKEKDPDQLNKVPLLLELFQKSKELGYDLYLRIDNSLHGKLYIGVKDEHFTGGIITSANFTENGLKNNHEWGVYFTDEKILADISKKTLTDASIELTEKDLLKMKKWMNNNPMKEYKIPTINVSFIDMIERNCSSNTKVTYWLKPLGKSPKPVPSDILFIDDECQITFTKKNPSGVKEGDVLIAYSVVSQLLISVFVAGAERGRLAHFDNPGDEQWPNYIKCRNLTPEYGAKWPEMKLTLRDVRNDFIKNSTAHITPTGNSINALQRGSDHIRLTSEFAEFLIDRMRNSVK